MDGTRFDTLTRRLTAGASRRQVVGGPLGSTAAVLTGATGLEAAKGGNGKGKIPGVKDIPAMRPRAASPGRRAPGSR